MYLFIYLFIIYLFNHLFIHSSIYLHFCYNFSNTANKSPILHSKTCIYMISTLGYTWFYFLLDFLCVLIWWRIILRNQHFESGV